MKSKKIFFLSLLFTLIITAAVAFFSPLSITGVITSKAEMLIFPQGSTYQNAWNKVDSLMKKGLTKSALQIVEEIYTKAKLDNNVAQIVKTIIHRIKLESYMEEYSVQKSIDKLDKEIKKSKYPLTPVLHSILAEMYWQFYQNNHWKFHNRTQTVDFKMDDINTWDLKSIIDHTIKHYQLSLQNIDSLKRTSLNIYDDIIINNTSPVTEKKISSTRKFRPSLYDFLAHRAVDFYMNEEPDIIKPAYKFELNNESYFSDYNAFAKQKIESKDTLSMKFYAVKILQDLLTFHGNDKDTEALIDVDLKRLKFILNKSIVEGKDSLYLQALQNLEKKFLSHPSSTEISYQIANLYKEKGDKYNPRISEDNKWFKKKAYEICENAVKRFPDSYGAKNCKYLLAEIKTKSINLTTEQVNIPDKPFRALLQYQNQNKVFFRIVAQDIETYNKNSEKYYGEELIKKFLSEAIVKEWSLDLPNDNDYQNHSVEIKIPELPFGHYVILVGSDKSFSYKNNGVAYGSCWMSNISYIQRSTNDGGYDVYVLHRENGNPLKNVHAQLWYQKYNYTLKKYEYNKGDNLTTDENGFFHISTAADEYRNYSIELTNGKDKLYTNNGIYLYKHYSQKKNTYLKTFFFTDRAIYRPGQTVYFKGIVLETDEENNHIVPNSSATVTLYDVNYQKVSSLDLTTNEYGTFQGNFILPQSLLNGQMHITDTHGTVYFSVEEYKRPKFEVTFPPIKGVYKLGEEVTVKGKALSYSGANVNGAEVKYRVVRNIYFHRSWYEEREYYPSSPEMEIINGLTTTNDTGGFVITFKAIPDLSISKSNKPVYSFRVIADITDITGETHSNENSVSVGYNAMKLEMNIPTEINRDSSQKFKIISENLNGEYEPSKGKIEIWKLKDPDRIFRTRLWDKPDKYLMSKAEFYSAFPNDVYDKEDDIHKWEKGVKVFTGEFDTDKNKEIILSQLAQWQSGAYVTEALTKDKFGEEVKDVKYFTLFSLNDKIIPLNINDWFTSLKDKGEPGEKASFIFGTRASNVMVLCEIEHKDVTYPLISGGIGNKLWLTLNNELKKIELPIEEKHRGNFAYHLVFVKNNRVYSHDGTITVPYTNKELAIEFETFRSKLIPGQKEEWKIKMKNKNGDKVAAEMLAAMYDASLDAFSANKWYFNIYNYLYPSRSWETQQIVRTSVSSAFSKDWNIYPTLQYRYYDQLNWFGYYYNEYADNLTGGRNFKSEMKYGALPSARESVAMDMEVMDNKKISSSAPADKKESTGGGALLAASKQGEKSSLQNITARKNLSETAFFFPQLETDANGNIIIKFTVPEALTKWKMMGFAHTKDLKYGQIEKEVVTQKDLMIVPHTPRFFREGDKIIFTAKVTNISDKDLSGNAELILYDAITMKDISPPILGGIGVRNFSVEKGKSSPLEWNLIIPEGISAITYKVVAKANNFSDGEESVVPVLTNRMLVTESLPLSIRGKQTKTFKFEKFISQNNGSSTLRNHKFTLEFSANPAWYALQSLPYIMEYSHECAEQVFSCFYANSIASHIANSSPKIKAVFDSWKSAPAQNVTSLLSNLEKNQELKSVLLEETPWVMDAKDESERKKRIGILFDLNRMANELDVALIKLQKMQVSNGGWPWFEKMPDNRYITQHIVAGMGHLEHLGIKKIREDSKTWNMVSKAIRYLDNCIHEDYELILKNDKEHIDKNHLGYEQIQYLYARSYFKDISIEAKNQKAFDYYKGQAKKYWVENNRYMQGMIALGLQRYGDKITPLNIMKSVKENALYSEEMGMYWKDDYEGYYWYESPIESHSLLVEAFDEVANDKKSVDDLRVWLLKSKQTQNWKSTKATTEAVYALLLRGTNWLTTESNIEFLLGDMKIDPKQIPDVKMEAGTGYFKTSWSGSDIKAQMGNITVIKKDEDVSWGAVYWQYFEQLDKITPHKTPLSLVKKLFLEKNTASGPVIELVTENTKLKPGDKLKVRIELRVDRNMEYIHMKDMRASGFEPTNVFSSYKYQDGLYYYESTRDAATNFFIPNLPKGTYLFEYPLVVSHNGDFSNGVTSIQCMYAPEFSSHSEGIRVRVEK
ncbi:MAG: alpha-2-macroglobulin family protein [Bacteroidota bacterium]